MAWKPTIVTRSVWGARAPHSRVLMSAKPRGSVVHHTTGKTLGASLYDDWVRNIQRYHMDANGWSDIGYNWLVAPDGTAFAGRGFGVVGAHVPAANSTHHGIAVLGHGDAVFGPEVARTIDYLHRAGGGSELLGHRELAPTYCPSDTVQSWVNDGAPDIWTGAQPMEDYRVVIGWAEDSVAATDFVIEAKRIGIDRPVADGPLVYAHAENVTGAQSKVKRLEAYMDMRPGLHRHNAIRTPKTGWDAWGPKAGWTGPFAVTQGALPAAVRDGLRAVEGALTTALDAVKALLS